VDLIHIRLKNGQDILGVDLGSCVGCANIQNPVQVKIHPTQGFYAQSLLLFSEEDNIIIDDEDILIKSKANQRGIDCYNSFFEEVQERKYLDDLDDHSEEEMEDRLMALIDSKNAVKH
jgi:nitrate/TMAO reductase-like tetraheme cytochrome c subunit